MEMMDNDGTMMDNNGIMMENNGKQRKTGNVARTHHGSTGDCRQTVPMGQHRRQFRVGLGFDVDGDPKGIQKLIDLGTGVYRENKGKSRETGRTTKRSREKSREQ